MYYDYINFCRDNLVPARTVHCFQNNKPWITSDIKVLLNQKKMAFRDGDREKLKLVQRELKGTIKQAKLAYKRKVERKLQDNNTRKVWKGMRTITGYQAKSGQVAMGDEDEANEFNLFFNRFSTVAEAHPVLAGSAQSTHSPVISAVNSPSTPLNCNPSSAAVEPSTSLPSTLAVTVDEVRVELGKLRPGKAAGPDGVCPRLLKVCAAQLTEPLQQIYNLSPVQGESRYCGKHHVYVKGGRPGEPKDYRTVALSSHIMKTLERLVLRKPRPQVNDMLDPLQFAYQKHIGVEDAVLYMLHRIHSHLDKPKGYVRIMSSTFRVHSTPSSPTYSETSLSGRGWTPPLCPGLQST